MTLQTAFILLACRQTHFKTCQVARIVDVRIALRNANLPASRVEHRALQLTKCGGGPIYFLFGEGLLLNPPP